MNSLSYYEHCLDMRPSLCCFTIVEKSAGVKSFLYQIAADPLTEDTVWASYGDSRSKFEFTNLDQGKKYWIRIIAIGSNSQAVQSNEVAQYVMQRTMTPAA